MMSEEKVTELRGCGGAAMPNEVQMQNTISQLRANAKSHKKTVDKLAAKVSQLTQDNVELRRKQKTKWETIGLAATSCFLFGFLATVGGICAYGWVIAMGKFL